MTERWLRGDDGRRWAGDSLPTRLANHCTNYDANHQAIKPSNQTIQTIQTHTTSIYAACRPKMPCKPHGSRLLGVWLVGKGELRLAQKRVGLAFVAEGAFGAVAGGEGGGVAQGQ